MASSCSGRTPPGCWPSHWAGAGWESGTSEEDTTEGATWEKEEEEEHQKASSFGLGSCCFGSCSLLSLDTAEAVVVVEASRCSSLGSRTG